MRKGHPFTGCPSPPAHAITGVRAKPHEPRGGDARHSAVPLADASFLRAGVDVYAHPSLSSPPRQHNPMGGDAPWHTVRRHPPKPVRLRGDCRARHPRLAPRVQTASTTSRAGTRWSRCTTRQARRPQACASSTPSTSPHCLPSAGLQALRRACALLHMARALPR